jgi:hypothetical protein
MRSNRIARVVVVLGSLTALSSILASIFGVHVILLAVGSTIFTIAAARAAFRLQVRQDDRRKVEAFRQERLKHQQEAKRSLDRAKLDPDVAELLRRAEEAVEAILASDARAENLLSYLVDENALSDSAQAISDLADEITDLRAELRSISVRSLPEGRSRPYMPKGGLPKPDMPKGDSSDVGELFCAGGDLGGGGRLGDLLGGFFVGGSEVQPTESVSDIPAGPMTADAIRPGQRAIVVALKSAESRLLKLERYALSVRKVDAMHRDWIGTQKAERLNQRFQDIVARTAADELAAKEFDRLTEKAAEAERSFHQSVEEADLAGETLVLPDDEDSGAGERGP